jgi:hypothetical protein
MKLDRYVAVSPDEAYVVANPQQIGGARNADTAALDARPVQYRLAGRQSQHLLVASRFLSSRSIDRSVYLQSVTALPAFRRCRKFVDDAVLEGHSTRS